MKPRFLKALPAILLGSLSLAVPAQQPADNGRLLASNCFQCHATNGINGAFGNLAGVPQKDLLEKLNDMRRKTAGSNLMVPHARGYTSTDLYWITYYFSRLPKP
jgi:cytochrome subunit of sulfide dehydrogenase